MDLLEKLRAFATDSSREGRLRLLMVILSVVVVVGSVLAALCALWATDKGQVQGAIVGGIFTLMAAMGGAFIVFYQLRRQASNTISANRHNELMKLKKEVYEEAQPIIAKAAEAQVGLNWCIKQFLHDIRYVRQISQWIPKTDGPALMTALQNCYAATRTASGLTDKWRIIDPRLIVIKMGLHAGLHDLGEAYSEYTKHALSFMAVEGGEPRITATKPDADEQAKLEELTDTLSEAIKTLHNYTYDFEVELQSTLLGELFDRSLQGRVSRGPDDKVLRLEDETELRKYFLEETSWGRSMPMQFPPS